MEYTYIYNISYILEGGILVIVAYNYKNAFLIN